MSAVFRFRLVAIAASTLMITASMDPATAGGPAPSYTFTVQNATGHKVQVQAFDYNDSSEIIPSQEATLEIGGTTTLKCNSNEGCRFRAAIFKSPVNFREATSGISPFGSMIRKALPCVKLILDPNFLSSGYDRHMMTPSC